MGSEEFSNSAKSGHNKGVTSGSSKLTEAKVQCEKEACAIDSRTQK